MRIVGTLFVCAGIAMGGCSSSSKGLSAEMKDAVKTVAQAFCKKIVTCAPSEAAKEAECVTEGIEKAEGEIDAETVVPTAAELKKCTDAVDALDCAALLQGLATNKPSIPTECGKATAAK